MSDIALLKNLTGLDQDQIGSIAKGFMGRYHANPEVLIELEKVKVNILAKVRKEHSVVGNPPELFAASNILGMRFILEKDHKAQYSATDVDEDTNQRKIKSRMAAITLAEKERNGSKLVKFLNRPDIFVLVSDLRAEKYSWDNISKYLAKYHSKSYKLAQDNSKGRIDKSSLSRAWKDIMTTRTKAQGAGEGATNDED